MSLDPAKPNIILILADNLGFGELGCYGGGVLRGAPTPNIDNLATEGVLCTNFNVESDCVPTRSALMSGRHPFRTGCKQTVPPGFPQGLQPWEKLLPEILAENGYKSAHFGKWHLGDVPGRYPTDRGFDEWYGIPRTTDESQFTESVGFDPSIAELPYIMEGKKGEESKNVCIYDLDQRRLIDENVVNKSIDFMNRMTNDKQSFFLYHPLIHLHFPTLPHRDFEGITKNGNFADSMVEMDHRVGQLLKHIDELGIKDNTFLIFASDNGPEFREPYRGSAGFYNGTYHTAMEGSLRVPFIARWPKIIPENIRTNEMIHVTDIFSTFIDVINGKIPNDRPIDGISQLKFLKDPINKKSEREGFLFFIKDDLRAIKWRDWKLHLWWEPEVNEGKGKLESPYLFNIIRDPKEQTNVLHYNTWVLQPMFRLRDKVLLSLKNDPAPKDPMKYL